MDDQQREQRGLGLDHPRNRTGVRHPAAGVERASVLFFPLPLSASVYVRP